MKEEKIILLIHKVVSDNANAQEILKYNEWLNANEQNKYLASEFQVVWDKTGDLVKSDGKLDKNKIKSNIFSKIAKEQNVKNNINQRHSKIIRLNSVASIAAIFLVVIGVFFIINNYFSSNNKIESTEDISFVSISDNSIVWLKKKSVLEFNKKFNDSERKLKLIGSAYFEIAPNKNKPFIISVESCKVKITGTSFDLITDINHNITVNLYSGKVQFIKPDNSFIELKEKQSLKYFSKNNRIEIQKLRSNNSKFKNHYLTFINENLEFVFDKISKYYSINFEIQCTKLNEFKGFTSQGLPSLNPEDYIKSIEKLYPIEIIKVDKNDFVVKCIN